MSFPVNSSYCANHGIHFFLKSFRHDIRSFLIVDCASSSLSKTSEFLSFLELWLKELVPLCHFLSSACLTLQPTNHAYLDTHRSRVTISGDFSTLSPTPSLTPSPGDPITDERMTHND
ncbi:hypothetical protein L2E82_35796 [Cichorium intybus]|uniref:Uncharacterized protein n=1 Tax=Cichorium intybus TaxID=13427 RepID=A0ACB9BPV0_CICIN|nr:hypothetical protein L2E82_35796 [Cichorium intybus]